MTAPVLRAVPAYVGIGANLGKAIESVQQAIAALHQIPQTSWVASSSLYASAPVDATGPDFINAVVRLDTRLDAETLLKHLQEIEQQFGRERPFRNAPRTLDLDLLLMGATQMHSAALELPHPRMTQRAFVLEPLLELDAQIVIPGKGPASGFLEKVADQVITRIRQ